MSEVRLTVNGEEHVLDVPVGTSLAQVLREEIGLTGTKIACNEGHCGACTVQLDGVPQLSCITLARAVEGEVTTIEGLREHPLVEAFVRADAVQCGYCTPGQICSAVGMLKEIQRGLPSAVTVDLNASTMELAENEVRECMSGNICRCAAYPNIVSAILDAGGKA